MEEDAMCNPETAAKNKTPIYAVCACGAAFFECPDDIRKQQEHIGSNSNPSHKWTYLKERQ